MVPQNTNKYVNSQFQFVINGLLEQISADVSFYFYSLCILICSEVIFFYKRLENIFVFTNVHSQMAQYKALQSIHQFYFGFHICDISQTFQTVIHEAHKLPFWSIYWHNQGQKYRNWTINNIPALGQIMDWHQASGDKPLSEPTRTTRTPAFWDTPRRPMITHTSDSHQIPSQNNTKSKLQVLKNCQNFKF